MEIAVFKTRLQDHKSCGIACQLYEARKVNRKSKLQEFVSSVQRLIQTCDVSKIGEGELVETKFGESPAGSFGSYQLTFQESNFKVMCNIPVNSARQLGTPFNTSANYPSLPLDDFNDDFVLNLPNDMANQIEEETRAQHTSETWVQEQKYRLTASKFGRIARRQRNTEKLCEDMLNAKPVKTKSTEHGIKYEPIALREYEKHMHKIGDPVKVEKSGHQWKDQMVSPWSYHHRHSLLQMAIERGVVVPLTQRLLHSDTTQKSDTKNMKTQLCGITRHAETSEMLVYLLIQLSVLENYVGLSSVRVQLGRKLITFRRDDIKTIQSRRLTKLATVKADGTSL
ncbi:hypothetical protein P5673_018779 [Acropora cervicornis]|uniref:Uncharacterized protein n=1 Tax=Acropora cervicornis TaxID=6130 RepID=A0AAD9QCA7_ACRCE|nr:hypothetical protein P5673_018779 [Acropora cervicornis]